MSSTLKRVDIISEWDPVLRAGTDAGFPNLAYVFNWPTRFTVLGDGGDVCPSGSGNIVQKVDGKKEVIKSDGNIDHDVSMNETLWETFKLSNGVTERADMIQLVFHKQHFTKVELIFSASYHSDIIGSSVIPLHPTTEDYGAEGKLFHQPQNFTPTLIRKIQISVDDLHGKSNFNWKASVQDEFEAVCQQFKSQSS